MTCIAAVRDSSKPNGAIVIGSDSSSHYGNTLSDAGSQKLFFVNLPHVTMLLGFAGQLAYGTALKYRVAWPDLDPGLGVSPTKDGVLRWIHGPVMDAIREGLRGAQVEQGDAPEGTAIVGVAWGAGKERQTMLLHFVKDQVSEVIYPYLAIGSGEEFAVGVLSHVFDKKLKPALKPAVVDALTASERHNAGVRGPFYVTELK